MRMGRRMCRIAPLRVGFLRVGFRVGFFSRLGVAAAPVAGVLSVFFLPVTVRLSPKESRENQQLRVVVIRNS